MGSITRSFANNILASGKFDGTKLTGDIPEANLSANAPAFDDNKIVNDLSTLGLRVHTQENLAASSTNSQYVDVFQDSTGIASHTTSSRDSSEFVSSTSSVTDPNTKGLWTTTIDSHGDAIGGSPGTPVVDSTGTLQLQSTDTGCQLFGAGNAAPKSGFGTKSIRTAGWVTGGTANNKGYYIREVSGQTSDLNFGTGAYTIEMYVKQAGSGNTDNTHQYIFDIASGSNSQRSTMAPYHSTTGSGTYNGSFLAQGGSYAWNDFGVGGDSNWKYVAFVRDGSGNVALFLNGTRLISNTGQTDSINYTDSNYLGIGQRHNGENAAYLYINNIRLSNVARYDPTQSSMTVPTSRLTLTTETLNATGSFESNAISTADSSTINKAGAVITYQDQSGTNALNTDIVLQISADNGSNYTTATLSALPDFSSGIKCAKVNDLTIGTPGTQLKYKILFANQSSGSKEARIRGVSLNY